MGQNNSSEQGLEKAFKVYLLLKVPGCFGAAAVAPKQLQVRSFRVSNSRKTSSSRSSGPLEHPRLRASSVASG
jgi:hypothetical protein